MKTSAEKSSTTASRPQNAVDSSHTRLGQSKSADTFFSKSESQGFFSAPVQAKLSVGKTGDKFEQEADTMAEGAVQRSTMTPVQQKCTACEEKDSIARKPLADNITPLVQTKKELKTCKLEENNVQKKEEPEKEKPLKQNAVQRMTEEKEEPAQTKAIQRQEENKEEPVQSKAIQRQEENKEEPVQTKTIQRQEENKEEPVQTKTIQRQEENKEEPVQTKQDAGSSRTDLSVIENLLHGEKGLGSKMNDAVRMEMESGYGVDLSKVRIHTDESAEVMSKALSAQAFTNGWDVYFNKNKYNPATHEGKLLLAHELAHTMQQAKANGESLRPAESRDESPRTSTPPPDTERLEKEAEEAANEILKASADQKPAPKDKPTSKAPKNQKKSSRGKKKESALCKPAKNKKREPVSENKSDADQAPTPANQSPKCPGADPVFGQAKAKIKQNAKKQSKHETPELKRDEMVTSAIMEKGLQEVQSGEDQKAMALEEAAKPKQKFDREVFKEKLKCKIESKMPGSEDEAKEFSGSNKLGEAKEEFSGTIKEEKGKVSGPLEATSKEALPIGKDIKPDNIPVPDAIPADKPSIVPKGLAAPKPRTNEEISLQHKSDGLDHEMAKEGITEQQLAESEEPQFEQALTKKKDAQREIAAAPGHYRQIEEQKLADSTKKADQKTGYELRGMASTKNKKTGDVRKGQTDKERTTEERQRQIKIDIDTIFKETEVAVHGILDSLSTAVVTIFNINVEAANQVFKSRVHSRLDDHYGWFTFDDKIAEWTGLSDGVKHIFVEEKERFLNTMESVLDTIATLVEAKLNEALAKIEFGRTRLEGYKKTLTKDELTYAAGMLEEAGEKFNELETSVSESQEELIDTLSDQYVESVNKLQEDFDKINEELSASWIADALSFIGDVASAIKKLANLLSSIVSRIGQYISDILAAPKRFFNNLVDGIKGGMDEFGSNIDKYLEKGFWTWLTGATAKQDIKVPDTMDAKGMFDLATQILNLNKEFFLQRIGAKLGKDFLSLLERAEKFGNQVMESADSKLLEPIRIVMNEGIPGLWTFVKHELSTKLDEIFSKLKEEIFQAIIKKFLLWVATLFIPGLGFIRLIQAAYKALRWLVDNIDRIVAIVNSFLDSVGLAVQGNVSGIKNKVIEALTLGVVIAIDFLAKLVGLGNFSAKLKKGIEFLRNKVTSVVDWLLVKIKPLARRITKFLKNVEKKIKAGVGKVKAGAQVAKEKGIAGAKKVTEKIIKWWKERKKFTNAAGEDHSLFFDGEGQTSKMMIASDKSTVEKYLTDYPNKKDPNLKNAETVFQSQNQLVISPKTTPKQRETAILALSKISSAFAKLSGLTIANDEYPKSKKPVYPPKAPPVKNTVEYIVTSPTKGDESTPSGRDTGTVGWEKVFDDGLTRISNKWVQMHVISHKLGGHGVPENLIPAPQHINSGFRKFENDVGKLVKTKSAKIKNVVWLDVAVKYIGIYATNITGEAGLYVVTKQGAGKTAKPEWKKDTNARIQDSRDIPWPDLYTKNKVSLNLSSGTSLTTVTKDKEVSKLIKLNRSYINIEDFKSKMDNELITISKYKKQPKRQDKINEIVGHKDIVLNNP